MRNPLLYERLIPFPFVSLPFCMITRWTVSISPDIMVWLYVVVSSLPYTCIPCMNRRKKGRNDCLFRWAKKKKKKKKKGGEKDSCKGFIIPVMIPGNAWRKEKKSNCQKKDETSSLWPIVPLRAVDSSHKARISTLYIISKHTHFP